ncbi:hypothetical protein WJX72_006152 [[Myrmecia] bisecta]|uniref:Uncharacterized protein n=1 Tax=[Myrmecia] bisecta TaxID=41462 RepID=A0AAW1R6N0_9CHLO
MIKLNYNQAAVPPQLQQRLDPRIWQSFMVDVDELAKTHPYVERPSAKQGCQWVLCGLIGSVIGICFVDPDGGDYEQFHQQVQHVVNKWQPAFQKCGLTLSQQHTRTWWLQIDVNPAAPGYPV